MSELDEKKSYTEFSKKIKSAREKIGLSVQEVASKMMLSKEFYMDLETFDDDVMLCLSINKFLELCKILKIKPSYIFLENPEETYQTKDIEDLVESIDDYLKEQNISLVAFEEMVGWEVRPILDDRSEIFGEKYSLAALHDICVLLNLDWLKFLPNN
ncbi:MAG: helix-turn-helix transcriptional regulator [Blastocatellia bacterium]|nr:helix-turn-helix transcriptional regulator [Blastocatellia bacterium]